MAIGRVALGEVALGTVGEPFGEGGGGRERVDFARGSFLDFHFDVLVSLCFLCDGMQYPRMFSC